MPRAVVLANSSGVANLNHPPIQQQLRAFRRSDGQRSRGFARHANLRGALPRQFRCRRQLAANHRNHVLRAIRGVVMQVVSAGHGRRLFLGREGQRPHSGKGVTNVGSR